MGTISSVPSCAISETTTVAATVAAALAVTLAATLAATKIEVQLQRDGVDLRGEQVGAL
jgi:hypothetical protein